MIQKTSASDKKPRTEICGDAVAVTNAVGVGVADHSSLRPKEAESLDLVMKRAGFKGSFGSGRRDPVKRNFNPPRQSRIALLSSEESEKLLASQSRRIPVSVTIKKQAVLVKPVMKPNASRLREYAPKVTQLRDERWSNQLGRVMVTQQNRVPKVSGNATDKNHPIQAPEHEGILVEQEPNYQDHGHAVAVPQPNGIKGMIRNADYDPTAREKVLEVLRFFKQIYKRLEQEKQARRGGDLFQGTSRIDTKTLNVIENMGKNVNVEKRTGSVPGIKVGDEFQYKTQLRAIGLHSKKMCGIDYMKVGGMNFVTSIVASERYGYKNKFETGFMVYSGEGGNMMSTKKKTHDQKLTKGNLALVNSMRWKREVRVIRGEEKGDGRSKRYVYYGLYMVEKYWAEKEDRGQTVYKFKLLRMPGQPPCT